MQINMNISFSSLFVACLCVLIKVHAFASPCIFLSSMYLRTISSKHSREKSGDNGITRLGSCEECLPRVQSNFCRDSSRYLTRALWTRLTLNSSVSGRLAAFPLFGCIMALPSLKWDRRSQNTLCCAFVCARACVCGVATLCKWVNALLTHTHTHTCNVSWAFSSARWLGRIEEND